MKGKDLVKLLKDNGWHLDRIKGSHHVMKKGDKTEIIPVHNTDLPARPSKCNTKANRT